MMPIDIAGVSVENDDHTKSRFTDPSDSTIVLYQGKNYIYIFGWGCIKQTDTIYVENENQDINKTYFLERALIESTAESESYHEKLKYYSQKDSLLLINVDSVKVSKNQLSFFLSFLNCTNIPVYILRTIGCIRPVKVTLINEIGKMFRNSELKREG